MRLLLKPNQVDSTYVERESGKGKKWRLKWIRGLISTSAFVIQWLAPSFFFAHTFVRSVQSLSQSVHKTKVKTLWIFSLDPILNRTTRIHIHLKEFLAQCDERRKPWEKERERKASRQYHQICRCDMQFSIVNVNDVSMLRLFWCIKLTSIALFLQSWAQFSIASTSSFLYAPFIHHWFDHFRYHLPFYSTCMNIISSYRIFVFDSIRNLKLDAFLFVSWFIHSDALLLSHLP